MTKIQNAWKHSVSTFELLKLPAEFGMVDGVVIHEIVIDKDVGSDAAVFIIDRTQFIYDIAKFIGFGLMLKTGLVATNYGPIMFNLFHIPDKRRSNAVFAAFDSIANPMDKSHMGLWRKLGNQTHWHVILVGKEGELVDILEFPNAYGVNDALNVVDDTCRDMEMISFADAKAEFFSKYSITDLL